LRAAAQIIAGNYVEGSLAVKRHLVRGTLAAEEARLLPFGLVRVHRTRLVNLNHAVAVEPRPSGDFALRMDTGETLVGSRRYKEAVARLRGSEVLRQVFVDDRCLFRVLVV
jgi:DNA-binding LytR/AlgR family response regulator